MLSSREVSGRYASLDGLRGLAALVVLVHHSLLVIPAFAAPYYSGEPSGDSAVVWWLVNSPLHILWAGTEAVYLFFVLSGVVLAIAARSTRFSWSAYFPSRLVRLYLPVAAATLFAAITIALVPRDGDSASAWVAARPLGFTATSFMEDVSLLGGVSRTVSPLWSLQWEVIFSLALPVYLLLAHRLLMRTQVLCSILLSTLGVAIDLPVLTYLPMFALGTAMGANWDAVVAWGSRQSQRPSASAMWAALTVVAVVLTTSRWPLAVFLSRDAAELFSAPMSLVGVMLVIIIAVSWRPARNALQTGPLRSLGLVSFSLYLVHEPIVIATAYLFDGSKLAVPAAIFVSLIVAVGFFLLVEKPAHRLARRIRDSEAARGVEAL